MQPRPRGHRLSQHRNPVCPDGTGRPWVMSPMEPEITFPPLCPVARDRAVLGSRRGVSLVSPLLPLERVTVECVEWGRQAREHR